MGQEKNKTDLVILDNHFPNVTELQSLKSFSNATFCRVTDNKIGLQENSKDLEIIKKGQQLYSDGIYRSVTFMTHDKGRDGDNTLKTAHKDIGIIRTNTTKLVEKIKKSDIKDLATLSGRLVKLSSEKIEWTKYAKYGKTQQIHIKILKRKDSRFTK